MMDRHDRNREGWLRAYSRGLIAAAEFADALLHDLVLEEMLPEDMRTFLSGYPDDVVTDLRARLRRIRGANFRWRPFLIGPGSGGPVSGSEAEDSARLRRIYAAV